MKKTIKCGYPLEDVIIGYDTEDPLWYKLLFIVTTPIFIFCELLFFPMQIYFRMRDKYVKKCHHHKGNLCLFCIDCLGDVRQEERDKIKRKLR